MAILRLTIDVDYIPHGTSERELRDILERAAEYLEQVGMLTGETEAEVAEWQYQVEALKGKPKKR
jgi:uncharacterized protein YqgV (UPF0045/DUF77 family)